MSEARADRPLRGTPLKRFHRQARRTVPSTRRVAFILEHVTYPANVGSVFRIADACRAEHVILVGTTADPAVGRTLARVARGKQRHVPWHRADDVATAAAELHAVGYWIAALEITADAQPYHTVTYPERVAFVLGNEDHGVTRAALAVCDAHLFIPMFGRGASLNVHVAAALAAYRALLSPSHSSPNTPST